MIFVDTSGESLRKMQNSGNSVGGQSEFTGHHFNSKIKGLMACMVCFYITRLQMSNICSHLQLQQKRLNIFISQNALSLLYLVLTKASPRRTCGMKLNRLCCPI